MENQIQTEKKNAYGKIFFQWEFQEVPNYKRGLVWYFIVGLVLVLLLGYSVFTRNFLFGVILLLFAFLFFLMNRNIKTLEVKIAEDGVLIGRKLYSYSDIEKFWIIYNPPEIKSLYFHVRHSLIPIILIPLEKQNPTELRKILLQYIQEDLEQKDEPPFDTFSRIFKL